VALKIACPCAWVLLSTPLNRQFTYTLTRVGFPPSSVGQYLPWESPPPYPTWPPVYVPGRHSPPPWLSKNCSAWVRLTPRLSEGIGGAAVCPELHPAARSARRAARTRDKGRRMALHGTAGAHRRVVALLRLSRGPILPTPARTTRRIVA